MRYCYLAWRFTAWIDLARGYLCQMWGTTSGVDPLGRMLASMDDAFAVQKVMVTQIPTSGVATIYSRIGDLFAWLCVAGLLGAIVLGLVP